MNKIWRGSGLKYNKMVRRHYHDVNVMYNKTNTEKALTHNQNIIKIKKYYCSDMPFGQKA